MSFVKKTIITISCFSAVNLFFGFTHDASAFTFPVLGSSSYTNDYNSPRGSGPHHATDIIADKNQPVVSATDGTIYYVEYPQAGSQGYMVIVRSTAGNYIYYIHLNNDSKGTDDGSSGGMGAYAPDVKAGNPVKEGQLLGWVGDSGNAESTVPHLHFEIRDNSPSGSTINPYPLLKNSSVRISKPVNYPELPSEILPFGSGGYRGRVNVARGDVTNDGQEDIVAGAEGTGVRSRVTVFSPNSKTKLASFIALSDTLVDGADVAVGDVDGDGKNELITAVKGKNHPKVAVYKYNNVTKRFDIVNNFVAYDELNTTPRVTSGDVDGNGIDEIIVGTGEDTSSIVNVFNAQGEVINTFRPFGSSFLGGIDVAAGNLTGTQATDEVVVGPLSRGSSRVAIFDVSRPGNSVNRLKEFYAHGASYRGGVRLSIGEVNRQNSGYEILASSNNLSGRPVAKVLSSNGGVLATYVVLEEWWRGYYDIAASRNGSYDYSFSTGGNRRGSIR